MSNPLASRDPGAVTLSALPTGSRSLRAGDPNREPQPSLAEQQYRAIFEISSDGLIINDLETGIVLEANPAACRMHDYGDAEEMVGLHPTAFIHPDSHHLFDAYLAALQEGREYRFRAQDARRDGTLLDVEIAGRSFVYHGRPAILSVIRDVTDEVRAYQTLEQRVAERMIEIERRREVAEGLRDLLAVVNSRRTLDEVLEYIVAQSCQLLGCDSCAIFLPVEEEHRMMLTIRAYSGIELEYSGVRLPVDGSSTGLAYSSLRPVVVSNVPDALPDSSGTTSQLETEELPSYTRVVRLPSVLDEESGIATVPLRAFASAYGGLLAVPLAVKDERYGALSLYYRQPHDFEIDEVALATAFADQTALALENARLREQAERAAVLEDRQRLARELHDAVTQTLFSASLIADVLPELWASNPTEALKRLNQLRRLTRGAVAEMRVLLVELRPQALCDLALCDLIRQLANAAAGSTDANVVVRVEGPTLTRLPNDVHAAIYRIAQESLNNTVKHARAQHIEVGLLYHEDGSVTLEITDDGCGFDTTATPPGHLGLGIMDERAQEIGARLQLESEIGHGTRIMLTWRSTERSAA